MTIILLIYKKCEKDGAKARERNALTVYENNGPKLLKGRDHLKTGYNFEKKSE